jgi:hypothetical protein
MRSDQYREENASDCTVREQAIVAWMLALAMLATVAVALVS